MQFSISKKIEWTNDPRIVIGEAPRLIDCERCRLKH